MSSTLQELRQLNVEKQRQNGIEAVEQSAPDSQIDNYPSIPVERQQESKTDRQKESNLLGKTDSYLSELQAALKSSTINVNFKCPTALNDLLEEYIGENWRTRPQKQDILRWGIQLALLALHNGAAIGDLSDEASPQ